MAEQIKTQMDRDTLAAFVDGELSPEDAALVMMHLDAHPQDQAFVDGLERSNKLLAQAFDAPLYEPVPERILTAIREFEADETSNVIPIRFGRAPMRVQIASGLLAASLALVVGIASWDGGRPAQLGVGEVASASMLSGVLDTVPTGGIAELTDIEAEATVLSSFFDGQSRPCREFELASEGGIERGIACRDEAGWTVAGRITLPEEETLLDDGFVPAEGAGAGELDAVLDEIGAGMILTHEEEEALIAAGWKN